MRHYLTTTHIILGGIAAYLLFVSTFKKRLFDKLASFIPTVEGFEAHPYWDVTRYSWGYGTAAPGSTGTITREQGFTEMVAHLDGDYNKLSGKLTRSLSINQWVALLSFSYNLGVGNAYKIVPLINAGNDTVLGDKWNDYVYAGGVVNSNLVDRRQKEWVLWNS